MKILLTANERIVRRTAWPTCHFLHRDELILSMVIATGEKPSYVEKKQSENKKPTSAVVTSVGENREAHDD